MSMCILPCSNLLEGLSPPLCSDLPPCLAATFTSMLLALLLFKPRHALWCAMQIVKTVREVRSRPHQARCTRSCSCSSLPALAHGPDHSRGIAGATDPR